MTVVSTVDGLLFSNSLFDYLYRETKLSIFCANSFFTFYIKVPIRMFERSENCHLQRFDLQVEHSQSKTHCLIRLKQPRASITNDRAIRIP